MGVILAPVVGSGGAPACICRVLNPKCLFSIFHLSMQITRISMSLNLRTRVICVNLCNLWLQKDPLSCDERG